MFKDFFRKSDIILMISIVIIGLISAVYISIGKTVGDEVEIKVNNTIYGTYSLNINRTIVVKENNNKNIVTIKDGSVKMSSASCKNQVCVHHSPISKVGESIICLPNKVIIRIKGISKDSVDAVSK